jgi:hypothetical protein
MAFARGPYAQFSSLPAPSVTKVHSSRKVDFATKRYVLDADGNPESQPTVQQIVAMIVAFNLPNEPLITPDDLESRRQTVVSLLSELTAPPAPLVVRLEVSYVPDEDEAGKVKGVINFQDASTGLDQTVEF